MDIVDDGGDAEKVVDGDGDGGDSRVKAGYDGDGENAAEASNDIKLVDPEVEEIREV